MFIILGAFLYSLFWNQYREPRCDFQAVNTETAVLPPALESIPDSEHDSEDAVEGSEPEPAAQPIEEPTPERVQTEETVEKPQSETEDKEETVVIEEKALFESKELYFRSGRSQFTRTPEAEAWLESAKKYLEQNPNAKLSITGHTDNTGSEAGNQKLSLRRANSVKSELEKEGFKPENMETSGMGSKEPIADNKTREGRTKNRRVSIKLIK